MKLQDFPPNHIFLYKGAFGITEIIWDFLTILSYVKVNLDFGISIKITSESQFTDEDGAQVLILF